MILRQTPPFGPLHWASSVTLDHYAFFRAAIPVRADFKSNRDYHKQGEMTDENLKDYTNGDLVALKEAKISVFDQGRKAIRQPLR